MLLKTPDIFKICNYSFTKSLMKILRDHSHLMTEQELQEIHAWEGVLRLSAVVCPAEGASIPRRDPGMSGDGRRDA